MHKSEEFFIIKDGRTRSKIKRDKDVIDSLIKLYEELYNTN